VIGGEIAPYSIVAGNPGRVLRSRFGAETRDRILRAAWWDWPIDHIMAHQEAICGGHIDKLEHAAP
jgi:virginiamycin A acetyltransferase